MTYADLKEALSKLNDTQLQQEVRWWGDETGGKIERFDILEEEYISVDNEPMEPRSVALECNDGEPLDESLITARLPAGTPILAAEE